MSWSCRERARGNWPASYEQPVERRGLPNLGVVDGMWMGWCPGGGLVPDGLSTRTRVPCGWDGNLSTCHGQLSPSMDEMFLFVSGSRGLDVAIPLQGHPQFQAPSLPGHFSRGGGRFHASSLERARPSFPEGSGVCGAAAAALVSGRLALAFWCVSSVALGVCGWVGHSWIEDQGEG